MLKVVGSAVRRKMAQVATDSSSFPLDIHIIRQLYYVAYSQGVRFPDSFNSKIAQLKAGVTVAGVSASVDRPSSDETTAPVVLRSNFPVPVCCSVYYFEVAVETKSRSSSVVVGVCSSDSSFTEWPGMESQSYGYHSNNGNIYHGAQDLTMSAPTFGEADVIGCGVNFVTNCLFFTKNGIFLGPINAGKKLPQPVYPCVAMSFPKCHLSVNFGHHKFAFDIGQYIARERAVVVGTAVDRKCTNQLAYVTMRSLVAAYLLHNGYLETATALGGWTSKPASTGQLASGDFDEKPSTIEAGTGYHQKASGTTFANGSLETPVSDLSSPHETFFHLQSDAHQGTEESDYFLVWPEEQDLLFKRRQLCDAIRCGDYLSALTQLEMHFQQLTKQDPSIGFVLRCHHFINLICNKPTQPQNESHTVTSTRNLASHVALSSDHSFNVTESHRGYAQKRPKPSDSLESSPEVGPSDYNCTSHSNSVNMHYQLDPDLSRHSLPRGPRSTHEHSPSSCQAPIRLRLSVPSAQSGRPESISECASVPVYPPHYHCHRERSASDNSIPPNLLNLADGGPDQVGNGALSGSHSTQDGRKRQHHITSVLRFPVYDSADIERGPNIVGTTVGLIDLSAFSSDGEPGQLKCPNNGCQCKSPPSSVGSPPTSFGDTTPQSALPLQTMDFQNNGNAVGDPIDCTDPSFVSESLSNGTIPFVTSNAPNCNTSCPPATSNPSPCCGQFGVEFDDGLRKPHKSPNEDSRSPCNWSMTDDVLHLVEYGRLLRSTALELLQQNAINPTQIQLLVGAFGLIAYENPYTSPFRQFLDPTHRERLADAVNSAILVHQDQPANPILDSALEFLQKSLVDERNSSHSRHFALSDIQISDCWSNEGLVDRLGRLDNSLSFTESRSAVDSNVQVTRRLFDPTNVYTQPQHSSTSVGTSALASSPRTRLAVTEVQSFSVSTAFENANNGGTTSLPHPFPNSAVSSIGVYIIPSSLISFGSRATSRNVTRVSSTSASPSIRPTSLTTTRPNSRSVRESHLIHQSPSVSTPSTPVMNTVLSWSTSEAHASARSYTRNPPPVTAPSAPNLSHTDSHVPSGPELAGFFHPIVFID